MDLKTSILVNRQVPEFVREEYPKFISFLEAYYEFLENKQGANNNNLLAKSKDLRYVSDVDYSLDEFEDHFYSTFLALIPKDVTISKDILIKNILPVYLAKGSEKAFKLLFRMLFGGDATISYPRENILRASDGKWIRENLLRVSTQIQSSYVGDGQTTEFRLAQVSGSEEIEVYVNGILQSDYYVLKELKKIVFQTAPADQSSIRVAYLNFDSDLLISRKVVGDISGAYAIIEKTAKRIVGNDVFFDLYIDRKTLIGEFTSGEQLTADLILSDGSLLPLHLDTLSNVEVINVIDGGASYNIGDPVLIRGTATKSAIAVVDSIATGLVEDLTLLDGGAGFQVGGKIYIPGIANTFFDAEVETVDSRGILSANTVTFYTDNIAAYASVLISAADYGFPASNVPTENVNTIIADALSSTTINVGTITTTNVLISTILASTNPNFQIDQPMVTGNIVLRDLGIMGKIDINDGGQNYQIGDQLIFTNKPGVFTGYGANAIVANVSTSGAITQVKILDGGSGYVPGDFPTITVSTVSGSSANLTVNCIMGDGERLQAVIGDQAPGQILSIKVIYPGLGYTVTPAIDLSIKGNGRATANAQLRNSYVTLPGKWLKSDGLLSTEEIRLQGNDYYINYSYVISSKIEFSQYKEVFKRLTHPSGFALHTEYQVERDLPQPTKEIYQIGTERTISGTVNVNSSIYIVGTNTKFVLANSAGILTVGNTISINSETRTVNSIISNTVITVSSPFTITSNDETLIITS